MADVTPVGADITVVTDGKRTKNGTGGATLAAGDFVYLDSNKYKGAANSSATLANVVGVLISPTTDNNQCTLAYQDGTEVDLGATLTEGTWYCVSSTAGKIHPFADLASAEKISWVGYGNPDGNLMMYLVNDLLAKS